MTSRPSAALGLRPHSVRDQLDNDVVSIGYFLVSGDAMVAEALGTLALDWVVIDMEASPMSKRDALHAVQALTASSAAAFVRVSANERSLIEHALDIGAAGLLVPKVNSSEEAAAVVDACRFPPSGHRGVNPVRASGYFADVPGYLADANAHVMCMVQVETEEAVEHAAEIAATEGIDVVFIGAGDLAMALGHPGDVDHPDVHAACAVVREAAEAAGTTAGIFAYSVELACRYADDGFRFIALGNEFKAIRESVSLAVERFRAGTA